MARTLPPLRLLTVFETVLRNGTITAAASELNVSQPAVSQALRQLEDDVGATLLDRSVRPPRPTPAGKLLHRATTDALSLIGDAMDEIGRLATQEDAAVTVACSVGFATYWLMPRLAAFHDRFDAVSVNVMTTGTGAPRLTEGVDVALRYGDGRWSDGVVTKLFDERVEPVCSPSYAARLAEAGIGVEAATLIHVDVDDEAWVRWPAYLRATGQAPGERRRSLRFTNYVQATQAALDGRGLMLGWESTTRGLLSEGRLVPAVNAPLFPSQGYHAVASFRPRFPTACDRFVGWLRECVDAPA